MAKHRSKILELATRGAEARLRELVQEARHLIGLFPHLRDSFDKDELPISFIVREGSGRLTKGAVVGRRRTSGAARRAANSRMKDWAGRRKTEK